MKLNNAQAQAITHKEGPLLVLAGPGSGKTFTITRHILHLIEEQKVLPEEILVITFTKDAALSMQQRFREQSRQTYPVNFGTFHSVFYHILNQSNGSNHRQILQEAQKRNLIFPIIKKYRKLLPGGAQNSEREGLLEDVTLVLSAISFYKNTGSMEDAMGKLPQEWRSVFEMLYKEYENARKQKQAIDFDDMVYECAEMLKKDAGQRKYWQNRFSHILVDEFQDINPMQYHVLGLLTKAPYNLFVVGDDDQAIYGFRGSKPACLKQFQKDYNAKQVLLNVNYRSFEEIIKASALVIAENRDRFAKKLVVSDANRQIEKASETAISTGEIADKDMHRGVAIHTFVDKEEQYRYLTQAITKMETTDTCAILFRTNSYMQGVAAGLRREGIRFVMKERIESIYEKEAVKDIMAYLRLASGEASRDLWIQILNKPSRYISREALAECGKNLTIEKLRAYYDNIRTDSSSFLYIDKIRSAIRTLEKQLTYLKNMMPYLAVQYIRRVIGYEDYLKENYRRKRNGAERLEEALELMDWLGEDAGQYTSVKEWLQAQEDYTRALKERENEEQHSRHNFEEGQSHIQLMTIHASKGLEFDHVWIPDCNEKIFPHGNMPDLETCEEERRIFYVGMTRAKKSLKLLCVTGTRERPRLISRFLNPLWKDYSSSPTISSNSH